MDTWRLIATERARLVDELADLTDEDWNSPSLCVDWRTRDVLAHIVSTAEMTTPRFLGGIIRNGFSFNRMVAKDIDHYGADGTTRLLQRLADAVTSHDHPPGPTETPLLETIVHGEDILFPLGRTMAHQAEALVAAAEFAKTAQPLIGCRKRIEGLSLRATDHDWSTGTGPEVTGPLRALLLAMCGRKAALGALSGPGVALLQLRP